MRVNFNVFTMIFRRKPTKQHFHTTALKSTKCLIVNKSLGNLIGMSREKFDSQVERMQKQEQSKKSVFYNCLSFYPT